MNDQKFGFAEIVDTCTDIIAIGKSVATALADGVQIQDAFVLIENFPRVQEISRDGRQAIRELADLTPDEAADAVAAIAERTDAPTTGVIARVNEAFSILARGYNIYEQAETLALDCVLWAKRVGGEFNEAA